MKPERGKIMGLSRAAAGALGGTLADQWKEFFYCEAMPKDILLTRGKKQITGRSSNTSGNDNIISNGSGIAVADGQCMLIVEQGKIVEVCAEPGEFTYDSSSEPSISRSSTMNAESRSPDFGYFRLICVPAAVCNWSA